MAKSQVLTGARAYIQVGGKTVGIFANCTWSIRQDKVPAYILGRFNPAEIVPTSQEPVTLNLTGYRVVGRGPYSIPSGNPNMGMATTLANLLNEMDFSVTVIDRQSGRRIFNAEACRVTGWSSGVSARGVSDIRLDVIGLRAYDESHEKDGDEEKNGAVNLTDGA
jgi:hypothetical protein